MPARANRLESYVRAIRQSGLTIYDRIEIGDPKLWVPAQDLEALLNRSLKGFSLQGLPLRTRSKMVKSQICNALGYPVPNSFKKSRPRFPGQLFDTYVQKSNNLQVWNEEVAPTRRYVIIRVSANDTILGIKVVTGDILAGLDTTGTLTQKYQARLIPGESDAELVSSEDTDNLKPFVREAVERGFLSNPIEYPVAGQLISIGTIFNSLRQLIGKSFSDKGYDQERNRGAELHRLVCQYLGYGSYRDDGRFPDVKHQLLEIKLQTSPTIDLGLICPDSTEPLDVPAIGAQQVRHCDVRYALFEATTDRQAVKLIRLFLTTGENFFQRFPKFQGRVVNKKLQIRLPRHFFDD
jgi:hypothetical protein